MPSIPGARDLKRGGELLQYSGVRGRVTSGGLLGHQMSVRPMNSLRKFSYHVLCWRRTTRAEVVCFVSCRYVQTLALGRQSKRTAWCRLPLPRFVFKIWAELVPARAIPEHPAKATTLLDSTTVVCVGGDFPDGSGLPKAR